MRTILVKCFRRNVVTFLSSTLWLFLCFASLVQAGLFEEETQRLLTKLAAATDEEDKSKILDALREIGPEARAAIPVLTGLLDDEEQGFHAAQALSSMGAESIDALRSGLRHKTASVRAATLAATGLSEMTFAAEALIPDIMKLLRYDEEDNVRRAIFRALSELRLQPAVTLPAIIEALGSDDELDAESAVDALWKMGPFAGPALPALEKAAMGHPLVEVRRRSLFAMMDVDPSGKSAIKALTHGLNDDTRSDNSMFGSNVQQVATQLLPGLAPMASAAIPTLLKVLKSDDLRQNHRRYAEITYTLAALGVPEAVPVLKRDLRYEQLRNRSNYSMFFSSREIPDSFEQTCIRVNAAAALARLQSDKKPAIAELLNVLEENQWSVVAPPGPKGARLMDPRECAATGLGLLNGDAASALPALKRAMQAARDEGGFLSVKAAWAIARIDRQDRSCLDVLKKVDYTRDMPNYRDSPFHRESPEDVCKILGPRIDDLVPPLIKGVIHCQTNRPSYWIDILSLTDDSAVVKLVEQSRQVIEGESWESYKAHRVLEILGPRAEPALDQIIELLDSKDHTVRANVARILGAHGKQASKVVPALRRLLQDDRVLVRVRAAEAIGQFGNDAIEAADDLRQLSKDDYQWVRQASARALAAITNPTNPRK